MMTETSVDPPTEAGIVMEEEEVEQKVERVTSFIEDTVENAGADGAVLGISGGIDSTTTAYLAVEALGADSLHGLVMPSEVNTEENMSDAERVAQDLGIEYDVLEIDPIFEAFTDTYPEGTNDELAAGNVRVRIRAVLNYYVANYENRVVLGTGNRSEALVGYFTKYGDGAVDCHPIGNLYKCQVRQLARHLGVPEDLVMQTPSAEMWDGQTDEGELGMTYDTLDAILALHIDGELSIAETAERVNIDQGLVERVGDLVVESEHKRRMQPTP
jgi:NAD+ synthase